MQPFNCEPILTDSQVLEFCKRGYLKLEAVVPTEINERTVAYREEFPEVEVHQLLQQPWFMEGVLCNAAVTGAIRSLLGEDFYLPHLIFSHRNKAPFAATSWHCDGLAHHSLGFDTLQVFYYPQDAPVEMGPTEFLPGSHFLYAPPRHMGHYDSIAGSIISSAPAGSVWITSYSIWHRRPRATAQGLRDVLKYCYFRQNESVGDWMHEPDFSPETADYSYTAGPTFREQFRECRDAAALFQWLRGGGEWITPMGGQPWYVPATYPGDERYGYSFDSES